MRTGTSAFTRDLSAMALGVTLLFATATGCGGESGSRADSKPEADPPSASSDADYEAPCEATLEGARKALAEITDPDTGEVTIGSGSQMGMLQMRVELGNVAAALDPEVAPGDLVTAGLDLIDAMQATDYDGSGIVDMTAAAKVQEKFDAVYEICSSHGAS